MHGLGNQAYDERGHRRGSRCQSAVRWPDRLSRDPVPIHPLVGYPAFEHACERAYRDGLRRHHALDDALANRAAWAGAIPPAAALTRFPQSTTILLNSWPSLR